MSSTLPATTDGALTELMIAYVDAYVINGGNQRAAAVKAGYAKNSAHVTASRLMRNPAVIRAIFERTTLELGASLPAALGSMKKLSKSAKSEHVRQQASADLLDRAGLAAPKQVRVGGSLTVEIDLS